MGIKLRRIVSPWLVLALVLPVLAFSLTAGTVEAG
jgi:hypothetical protein